MILKGYKISFENFVWHFVPKEKTPIIVTVPHDGFSFGDLAGFFKKRKKGVCGRDKHVWPIVKDILLQSATVAVRGNFPRHFVDYNRHPRGKRYGIFSSYKKVEPAFQDETTERFYWLYHNTVKGSLKEIFESFISKEVALFDFHGFTRQPSYGEYDLILGTGNGKTIFNKNRAIDQRFAHFLAKRGYKVFLPKNAEQILMNTLDQNDEYDGDFTVHHCSRKYRMDAIQVEIASKFRQRNNTALGKKLSNDIADFFELIK